jgi:hypothetical protein
MQVVGLATKGGALGLDPDGFSTLRTAQERWNRAEGKVRFGPLHVSPKDLARAIARDLPRAVAQRARARLSGQS